MSSLDKFKGAFVKMSQSIKDDLIANDCQDHVDEFGECLGVVDDEVDYGGGQLGPEVNVRWQPSNLRYGYDPDQLVIVESDQ